MARMVVYRDLDHGYYEYPGLVFYLLAPAVALARPESPPGPSAFLAARAVVAAFGVASVALVYALGRRLAGGGTALTAALLVAVSPIEVDVAHMVRPDIVLETFVLAAMLAFLDLDGTRRADARAGVALGGAIAVKFSGVLLAPSYLVARVFGPRVGARGPSPLLRAVAVTALVAAAVALVCTPYAVLRPRAFLEGTLVQVGYHYEAGRGTGHASFLEMAATYGRVLLRGVGPLAWLALGLPLLRGEWRRWLPLAVFPVTAVLVFSTSDVKRDRFMVASFGVVAVCAAWVAQTLVTALTRRWPQALAPSLAVVALAAAAPPAAQSLRWLGQVRAPSTWDRVVDWIARDVPSGAILVSDVPDLGLDPTQVEIVPTTGAPELDRRLVLHAGHLVASPVQGPLVEGLSEVFRADSAGPAAGPAVAVYEVPSALRPEWRPIDLGSAHLAASENPEALHAIHDGDPATAWTTAGAQQPGQWVQVDLGSPMLLGRAELLVGPRLNRRGALLRVLADEGSGWRRVRVAAGRVAPEEQRAAARERSQVLVLEPIRARSLRIVQDGTYDHRWAIGELRLDALAGR